jgi:hypothetical protein
VGYSNAQQFRSRHLSHKAAGVGTVVIASRTVFPKRFITGSLSLHLDPLEAGSRDASGFSLSKPRNREKAPSGAARASRNVLAKPISESGLRRHETRLERRTEEFLVEVTPGDSGAD